MTRPVPQVAVDFVSGAEGCVLRVYDDKRPNYTLKPGDTVLGTLTAGYGHTGADLAIGLPVTKATALIWLDEDLGTAADRLAEKLTPLTIASLTTDEYAAFLSFVFNLGTPGSTIWAVANAGQLDQVPVQMMRFDMARDKATGQLEVVPGLIHRRMAEVALWKTPDAPAPAAGAPVAASSVVSGPLAVLAAAPVQPPPSSVTRNTPTPPQPAPVKPLHQSKSFIAQVGTAILGLGGVLVPVVQQINEGTSAVEASIKPYVGDGVAFVDKMDHVMVLVLAVTAATAVLLTIRKQINMANG